MSRSIRQKAKSRKMKSRHCALLSACSFLLFALTVSLHSCHDRNADLREEDRAKISEEVKDMLLNYAFDIKEKGLTAEFDYLDNSSDFFWAPPGYGRAISYDSVANILKTNADHFRAIENSYDSLSVIALKNDLAIYNALITSSVIDTEGSKSTVHLVETGVVIKRKNGWKLLSGQTSLIAPNLH
jgi:hypothetical protein